MPHVLSWSASTRFVPLLSLLTAGLNNGHWCVVEAEDLGDVASGHDRQEEMSDVKYSPNGAYLAVASHDNYIDIYDAAQEYKRIGVCKGHSSYLTHIDWSADSHYLQSTCGAYELLYWDATKHGKQVKISSSLKDVEWHTQTCVLGWTVMGIWPEGADGTDCNAVMRSNDKQWLATADDFGGLKLMKYPCINLRTNNLLRETGHSSHVTNVCWSFDDSFILTTGVGDCSVFQWKFITDAGLD